MVKIALMYVTEKLLVWEFSLRNHFEKAIHISLCLSQKETSLAPKLTKWRPFKVQNSNGHGGLNF